MDQKTKTGLEKQTGNAITKIVENEKPTALAIKEQVSVEVDEKLRKVASESTSKILSATTSLSSKHKTGLAQLISKSLKETKTRSETATESLFETEEGEEAGLIIQGRIKFSANILNDWPKNMLTNPSFYEQN